MGKLFDRLRASRGRSNMYIDNDRLSETANYADQRLREIFDNVRPDFASYLLSGAGLPVDFRRTSEENYNLFKNKWNKAHQDLQNADVTLTAPEEALEGIFGDKRFKNQFETNTSRGVLDNHRRGDTESLLGAMPEMDASERPKYAYIGDPHSAMSGYGDNQFLLKPEVKENMTYTIGDSLDDENGVGRYGVADWTTAFGGNGIGHQVYDRKDIEDILNELEESEGDLLDLPSHINQRRERMLDLLHGKDTGDYIEGQIWGPLGLGDVKRLRLTDDNYLPMAKKAADDFGFRLETIDRGPDGKYHWTCKANCEE